MLIAILAGVLFKMFEEDAVDSLVFIKRNITFRECLLYYAPGSSFQFNLLVVKYLVFILLVSKLQTSSMLQGSLVLL